MEAVVQEKKDYKCVHGDLLSGRYGYVHPGVYSSRMWLKMRNRRCENLLLKTEKFATMNWLLRGSYPNRELISSWENVLFSHFHDVMGGCCIDEVYPMVREKFAQAEETLERIREASLRQVAKKVDTSGEGTPLPVFNSLAWRRGGLVSAQIDTPGPAEKLTVMDTEGRSVPCEVKDAGDGAVRVSFEADVPALGYAVYYLEKGPREPTTDISFGAQSWIDYGDGDYGVTLINYGLPA